MAASLTRRSALIDTRLGFRRSVVASVPRKSASLGTRPATSAPPQPCAHAPQLMQCVSSTDWQVGSLGVAGRRLPRQSALRFCGCLRACPANPAGPLSMARSTATQILWLCAHLLGELRVEYYAFNCGCLACGARGRPCVTDRMDQWICSARLACGTHNGTRDRDQQ